MENKQEEGHPLVTVVTATFNLVSAGRVDSLRQCLESVHAQLGVEVEHIIIDGASSDGTLDILQEYEKKGWVKVFSEPDSGIYDAFNKGVQHASGTYCAFLNSDDFWHDARGIAASVHLLELSGGDFSYAPVTFLPPDGRAPIVQEPDFGSFCCDIPFCHQTMFCRTEHLRRLRFDQEHFRLAADYDLFTRLVLSRARGVYVPLNFTTFRLGGVSGNAALHREEFLRIYQRYYAPVIGEEAAAGLYDWAVPARLIRVLATLVHPDVLGHLERSFVPPYPGAEILTYRSTLPFRYKKWKGLLGLPLMTSATMQGRTTYRVLGFLPVLTRTCVEAPPRHILHTRLFGVLPLLRQVHSIEKRCAVCSTWLLGCLPFWKRSCMGGVTVKHYLFCVLPVWSSKKY